MVDFYLIKKQIELEFADIIDSVSIYEVNEMRIILIDETFIDVWFSLKLKNRYSYHWERRFKDNTIYRHDNIPHKKWQNIKTFPKHFHDKGPYNVKESFINENINEGIVEFLTFAREKLKSLIR